MPRLIKQRVWSEAAWREYILLPASQRPPFSGPPAHISRKPKAIPSSPGSLRHVLGQPVEHLDCSRQFGGPLPQHVAGVSSARRRPVRNSPSWLPYLVHTILSSSRAIFDRSRIDPIPLCRRGNRRGPSGGARRQFLLGSIGRNPLFTRSGPFPPVAANAGGGRGVYFCDAAPAVRQTTN